MNDYSTSLLLLLVALVLLWLAVTDRLTRLLDAYDVLTGKMSASGGAPLASATPAPAPAARYRLSLPALPALGHAAEVGV